MASAEVWLAYEAVSPVLGPLASSVNLTFWDCLELSGCSVKNW